MASNAEFTNVTNKQPNPKKSTPDTKSKSTPRIPKPATFLSYILDYLEGHALDEAKPISDLIHALEFTIVDDALSNVRR